MVSPSVNERVLAFLKQDSAASPHAYPDSHGYLRIGLHRSVDYRIGGGLSMHEIEMLARNDLQRIQDDLRSMFAYALKMPEPRTAVLIELAYLNEDGAIGVLRNLALMDAIKQRDYIGAADTITNSALGAREPRRAARLREMMISGQWPNCGT